MTPEAPLPVYGNPALLARLRPDLLGRAVLPMVLIQEPPLPWRLGAERARRELLELGRREK